MVKKTLAAVCLAVSLCFRLFAGTHGQPAERSLLIEPLVTAWVAFLLPAALPVIAVEEIGLHYAAWTDGHAATTTRRMVIAAAVFWLFPVARLVRLFGWFNPFQDGKQRRPLFTRGIASGLDMLNKRLFGRQKTGGWA